MSMTPGADQKGKMQVWTIVKEVGQMRSCLDFIQAEI